MTVILDVQTEILNVLYFVYIVIYSCKFSIFISCWLSLSAKDIIAI